MEQVDAFLEGYGVAAIFVVMLVKAAGVPIPIPADLIMLAAAARAAEGKLPLGHVFVAMLLALVVGGLVQFGLVRRVGRMALYRLGRYVGLTPSRLDLAAAAVQRGGPLGVSLAVVTPGVRAGAVAACALAAVPLRSFFPGLVAGSTLFLALHFTLGYSIGPLVVAALGTLPVPVVVVGGVAALVAGFGVWALIRVRGRAEGRGERLASALGAWYDAACPLCLAAGVFQARARSQRARQSQDRPPGGNAEGRRGRPSA